jgi:histidine triad (HIT) family protein
MMTKACVFCSISSGAAPASVIAGDALTLTFVDLRQWHPGHVLVIPRQHFNDIRDMDDATLHAVISAVSRAARAVDKAFPSDGISIWHSAGEGANQEVSHAHFHVHPRFFNDGMLAVYRSLPENSGRTPLDAVAARLRAHL